MSEAEICVFDLEVESKKAKASRVPPSGTLSHLTLGMLGKEHGLWGQNCFPLNFPMLWGNRVQIFSKFWLDPSILK